MLFNTYTFLIFFAFVMLVTRLVGNWRACKTFLLICSYLFYAAWNPPFVILLWISTLADWFISNRLGATENPRGRKVLVWLSLFVNLGMLSFFKYGNFLIDNFNFLMSQIGYEMQAREMNIILPIGISFYTFQTLSYTLDIYFKKMRPWHSFLDYALYVTFFPQLVAGPIVRASEFLPQCIEPKKGTPAQIGWGLYLFVIGLFSKVVLADALMSVVCEALYNHPRIEFAEAWTASIAFGMQIFYDFFGYSTCAIGIALCMGFELPDNFRFPFASHGITDFWKRWHITLSTWLRDYLYIPLGGSRKGEFRSYVNLMVTMLLGGLWHGAAWQYVLWGGLHGVFLMIERLLKKMTIYNWKFWDRPLGQWFLASVTFVLFCFTLPIFRSGSLEAAYEMSRAMLDLKSAYAFFAAGFDPTIPLLEAAPLWQGFTKHFTVAIVALASFVLHNHLRDSSFEAFFERMNPVLRVVVLATMVYLTLISMAGEDYAFIYFQF